MGMNAAYVNTADKTHPVWIMKPNQWGSCMASFQTFGRDTSDIPAEATVDGVLDTHVYLKLYGNDHVPAAIKVVKLVINSPFFRNLTGDPTFRVLKTPEKSCKGIPWEGSSHPYIQPVDKDSLLHIGFNGECGANGLITGFRYINQLLSRPAPVDRIAQLPDELIPLSCFLFVCEMSDNYGSDGSLSMLPATGADLHEYCRIDCEDLDEVYYDNFTEWLYNKGNSNITLAQVADVYTRSEEDMRALGNQNTSLLRHGYLKDEQLGQYGNVPDDATFNMSISAPLYLDMTKGNDAPALNTCHHLNEQHLVSFVQTYLNK